MGHLGEAGAPVYRDCDGPQQEEGETSQQEVETGGRQALSLSPAQAALVVPVQGAGGAGGGGGAACRDTDEGAREPRHQEQHAAQQADQARQAQLCLVVDIGPLEGVSVVTQQSGDVDEVQESHDDTLEGRGVGCKSSFLY